MSRVVRHRGARKGVCQVNAQKISQDACGSTCMIAPLNYHVWRTLRRYERSLESRERWFGFDGLSMYASRFEWLDALDGGITAAQVGYTSELRHDSSNLLPRQTPPNFLQRPLY